MSVMPRMSERRGRRAVLLRAQCRQVAPWIDRWDDTETRRLFRKALSSMSFFRRLNAGPVATNAHFEKGFTLIELMVVVLIIAILIAIAIPTFLGARTRSQDRAAESELRNASTAEKVIYTDNQTFDATTAKLKTLEPSLNWNGGVPVTRR